MQIGLKRILIKRIPYTRRKKIKSRKPIKFIVPRIPKIKALKMAFKTYNNSNKCSVNFNSYRVYKRIYVIAIYYIYIKKNK